MNVEEGEVNDDDLGQDDTPEEVIREAKNMGWVPKDQFKGKEDKWIPAADFVERGKHVLPILLENNKRLQNELLTRDKKIDTLSESLKSSQKAIEAIQKTQTEATKRAVEAAIVRVKQEIKDARQDGDVDAELALQDKLAELKKSKDTPPTATVAPAPPKQEEGLTPEFIAWNKDNPWFGDNANPENKKRTKEFLRIAEDLRDEGVTLTGRPFMDAVLEKLDKRLADADRSQRPPGKVESGSLGRGGSGKKGYNDLPSDAKAACDEYLGDLVGPNKQYKTAAEWRTAYAKTYFGEE